MKIKNNESHQQHVTKASQTSWLVAFCERGENRGSAGTGCHTVPFLQNWVVCRVPGRSVLEGHVPLGP